MVVRSRTSVGAVVADVVVVAAAVVVVVVIMTNVVIVAVIVILIVLFIVVVVTVWSAVVDLEVVTFVMFCIISPRRRAVVLPFPWRSLWLYRIC